MTRRIQGALACLAAGWLLSGCASYKGNAELMSLTMLGSYGEAREEAITDAITDPRNRSYLLDRQKILVLSVAEGVPESAEGLADYVYDQLRTQGLNADKGVATFLVGERGVRIWKGEPFEQAMAYYMLAVLDGMLDDWGNVRASASGSIFQLRDLSQAIAQENADGEEAADQQGPTSPEEQVRQREAVLAAAEENEKAKKDKGDDDSEDDNDLGVDYAMTASDFELGYVMKAIAERHLGYPDLQQTLDQLTDKAPRLDHYADAVRNGDYNTVLVVDYGLAPQKIATGMDGVIAAFEPRTPSDDAQLVVSTQGREAMFPIVTDVNRLATDLKWNNLEDMRKAKSYIGTALVVGGAATAATADSWEQALAGLLIAAAGAAMKASAKVDTRHCELLPQRTYVALLHLEDTPSDVEVHIAGKPGTRVVLPDMEAPGDGLELAYLRLPMTESPPTWAVSGEVFYASDFAAPADVEASLPFVLGGRCVRTPTPELVSIYRLAGLPDWVGYEQLMMVYQQEGIVLAQWSNEGEIGRHVLEGGKTLYSPHKGSMGFVRLFGQEHSPYRPTGPLAKSIIAELNGVDAAATLGGADDVQMETQR